MKKVLMLLTALFSQVFFASDTVQCADIKSVEKGEGNLYPAHNDNA